MHCIYKAIYFIIAVAWGYKILKDEPYFPPSLGGKGDLKKGFVGYPYAKHSPQFKEILLWTSAYHFGGFLTHLFGPKKNDFMEMALHHLCAIYLYGGCYIVNGWEMGQTIAFLHDIADIFVNLAKFFTESRSKPLSLTFALCMISSWLYTRVLLLPKIIYDVVQDDNTEFQKFIYVKQFFCVLLLCMWMLHCYWFKIFMVMLHNAIFKNKYEDL